MRRPRFSLLLSSLILLAGACPGRHEAGEAGEQCWDGKDNDSDGLLDCKDPDCALMGICQVRLDGGAPPPGEDLGRPTDMAGHKDKAPPPPAGSYGQKCAANGQGGLCPDGKHRCLTAPNSGNGFCTRPCAKLGDLCTGGPAGTFSACLARFNGQPYCAFLCKLQGNSYPCPAGFSCVQWTSTSYYCWP